MKRQNNNTIDLCKCPRCQATCLIGHDDDGQVYCAKCGNSFIADNEISVTPEEYRKISSESTKYERGGWTAFDIIK